MKRPRHSLARLIKSHLHSVNLPADRLIGDCVTQGRLMPSVACVRGAVEIPGNFCSLTGTERRRREISSVECFSLSLLSPSFYVYFASSALSPDDLCR